MYARLLKLPEKTRRSFFVFGPRGTGKTLWLRTNFPNAVYIDLLDTQTFLDFSHAPGRLEREIPEGFDGWVVIDEVQRIPALLHEVHRLIEARRLRFILTGSSARTLKRKGVDLLAGRALTQRMHPLTVQELGDDFDLSRSLCHGHLPSVYTDDQVEHYLEAYVETYLREEVMQEGLTRNLGAFARFLQIASLSQGALINYSEIAREARIHNKTVAGYVDLVEDLLLAVRIPVFSRRAKRRLVAHAKFYFFDVGVYQALRPKGPLDTREEGDGAALETLVFQELRALNDYLRLGYSLHFWRTASGQEVDFILYGPAGLHAIEVKRRSSLGPKDLKGLRLFRKDYPEASCLLFYGGDREQHIDGIRVVPIVQALHQLPELISQG